jgi:MFS transporter, putative metabolite:H+ symporter
LPARLAPAHDAAMIEAAPVTEQGIIARIERLPYSRWHVTVTVALGIAIFFDSFDSLALAYVLPVIVPAWHIAPAKIGGLISIANLGQAVGAFVFGWVAERWGRVPAARMTIALYAVMSFACAFTTSYDQLFWCRFVEGIGLGGEIPVASTYISEILRAERRGGTFLAYQMIFPVGLFSSGLAGAFIVPRLGWQWMFILGAVPALLALALRQLCPESPRWLASKGRLGEADRVMSGIERIVSAGGARALPPVPELPPALPRGRTRWRELFEGRYRARTLLVWVLWASCYVISYGMSGWVPTLYREVYHLPLQQSLLYAAASPGATIIGSFLCALLIDRIGRRIWFMGAFFLAAAGLVELWAGGATTAFGMLLGYSFTTMWLGSVNMSIFLYTAEIYPTRMRALGVAWSSFWLRIAATVGPLVVGFVLPRYGIGGVFLVFSLCAVTGCVASLFAVETRRRVLEEVSP